MRIIETPRFLLFQISSICFFSHHFSLSCIINYVDFFVISRVIIFQSLVKSYKNWWISFKRNVKAFMDKWILHWCFSSRWLILSRFSRFLCLSSRYSFHWSLSCYTPACGCATSVPRSVVDQCQWATVTIAPKIHQMTI